MLAHNHCISVATGGVPSYNIITIRAMEIASCSYVFLLTKDISVSYSYLVYQFGTGGHTQKAKPETKLCIQ